MAQCSLLECKNTFIFCAKVLLKNNNIKNNIKKRSPFQTGRVKELVS